MDFGTGHLYHDAEISNTFTSLDAKEKLRTRQINAREEKQLMRFNKSLDRAHTVLVKRQNWEKNHIEQELQFIKLKSPPLNKSLKKSLDLETCKSEKLPQITSRDNSLVKGASSEKSSDHSGSSTSRSKSVRQNGKTNSDLRYTAEIKAVVPNEPQEGCVTVYMKKADAVARNLSKLYKRKRDRTTYIKEAVEIIRANNQELLNEARLYILKQSLASPTQDSKSKEGDASSVQKNEVEDGRDEYDENSKNIDSECKLTTLVQDENTRHGENGNLLPTLDNSENNNEKRIDSNKEVNRMIPRLERISSVIVNPSDGSSAFDDKNGKWTDIFRVPEMWKLFDGRKKVKEVAQTTPQALVTLRGKLRKTLLR